MENTNYISRRRFRKNIKNETSFYVDSFSKVLNLAYIKHKNLSCELVYHFESGEIENIVIGNLKDIQVLNDLYNFKIYLESYYAIMKSLGLNMRIKQDKQLIKSIFKLLEEVEDE